MCSKLWTVTNKPIRDAPKLSKPRSAVLDLALCSKSQSTVAVLILYTFIIVKVSTQKKTRPLLDKLRLVSFLWLSYGVLSPTGRGVVRASHIHSAKMETMKIYSEESGSIFTKFAPAKICCYTASAAASEL